MQKHRRIHMRKREMRFQLRAHLPFAKRVIEAFRATANATLDPLSLFREKIEPSYLPINGMYVGKPRRHLPGDQFRGEYEEPGIRVDVRCHQIRCLQNLVRLIEKIRFRNWQALVVERSKQTELISGDPGILREINSPMPPHDH